MSGRVASYFFFTTRRVLAADAVPAFVALGTLVARRRVGWTGFLTARGARLARRLARAAGRSISASLAALMPATIARRSTSSR